MEFKQAVVTQNGRALMAKLLAGKSTQFTKIKVSSTVYQDGQLANLTSLTNIKQETSAQAYGNNTATVSVVGAIENTGLTAGYYINTVGLYAQDPDKGEILYSVSSASVNGYMPPDTGVSKSGFEFKIYTEVGNATKVDLTVDPAAFATHEDIERLEVHQAWATGENGEGLSQTFNENLLPNSTWNLGKGTWIINNEFEILEPEEDKPNSKILHGLPTTNDTQQVSNMPHPIRVNAGETFGISFDYRDTNFTILRTVITVRVFPEATTINSNANSSWTTYVGHSALGINSSTSEFKRFYKVFTVEADGWMDILPYDSDNTGNHETWLREITVTKISNNTVQMVWFPAPEDDPINAYPKYVGFGIKSSDNYQDYRWILNPDWAMANALYGTEITTLKSQLSDMQTWIQAHS